MSKAVFFVLFIPMTACASYNPTAGGGGGGGSSTLAVSSGSATNSVIVSSPTSNIVFDSNTVSVSLQGTTTSFFSLLPSSVTLHSNQVVTLSTNSHIITNGPTPNLINCGAGPTVTGDDTAGFISVGGGLPSTCVLQFANTWGVKPACVAIPTNTIAISLSVTSSTSTTISFGSPPGGINYHCRCAGASCI